MPHHMIGFHSETLLDANFDGIQIANRELSTNYVLGFRVLTLRRKYKFKVCGHRELTIVIIFVEIRKRTLTVRCW
jgi:hypothetical protein